VWCLTIDLTTGVRSPTETKHFSFSLCVQSSSEAHQASYRMGTVGFIPRGKARAGHDADHSLHLVPRFWMSRSYTSSPLGTCIAQRDSFALIYQYNTVTLCFVWLWNLMSHREEHRRLRTGSLWEDLELTGMKWREGGENCIMWSTIVVLFTIYY
jgi:hypothetical protein